MSSLEQLWLVVDGVNFGRYRTVRSAIGGGTYFEGSEAMLTVFGTWTANAQ